MNPNRAAGYFRPAADRRGRSGDRTLALFAFFLEHGVESDVPNHAADAETMLWVLIVMQQMVLF